MSPAPSGFTHVVRGERVEITHAGRPAVTLRGSAAAKFLDQIERSDPQHVMARVTGDDKRGAERR